jgi:hypothetical protein
MRLTTVDISEELQLHSLHADLGAQCCSKCLRRPLPGELVHVYDGGKTLCTLCMAQLPDEDRVPLRSERVYATGRRLAVVPRAA